MKIHFYGKTIGAEKLAESLKTAPTITIEPADLNKDYMKLVKYDGPENSNIIALYKHEGSFLILLGTAKANAMIEKGEKITGKLVSKHNLKHIQAMEAPMPAQTQMHESTGRGYNDRSYGSRQGYSNNSGNTGSFHNRGQGNWSRKRDTDGF